MLRCFIKSIVPFWEACSDAAVKDKDGMELLSAVGFLSSSSSHSLLQINQTSFSRCISYLSSTSLSAATFSYENELYFHFHDKQYWSSCICVFVLNISLSFAFYLNSQETQSLFSCVGMATKPGITIYLWFAYWRVGGFDLIKGLIHPIFFVNLMLFQTWMTDFHPWNTKGEVIM